MTRTSVLSPVYTQFFLISYDLENRSKCCLKILKNCQNWAKNGPENPENGIAKWLDTLFWWKFAFKHSSLIPNTSRKSHALEKSGPGFTVVARPLFWDKVVFLTFLCDTTLWQSDVVVWTTWNLDRMCTRYRYLKLKNLFSIFFSKIFSLQIFFSKIFFEKLCFSQIFSEKKFPENFLDFVVQKSFLTKKIFVVADINLTSGVHCILALFRFFRQWISYLVTYKKNVSIPISLF